MKLNLYRVAYRQWNSSFSGMYECEELSVGISEEEAIERVKSIADKDARDFEAAKIETVFGMKILIDGDEIQISNGKRQDEKISIRDIAIDVNKQKIFDAIIEEACRQWCCFADDAPERRDGEGFANFFYETFKEKEQEYLENYNEPENQILNEGLLMQ